MSVPAQERELARGQGKPPSVLREYVEDCRYAPKDCPGQVGAVLPKDLPASVECTRGEVPLLVSPRSLVPLFPGRDVSQHEFEEIDRSARRSRVWRPSRHLRPRRGGGRKPRGNKVFDPISGSTVDAIKDDDYA